MRLFDFSLLVGTDPRSSAVATEEALVRYLDAAGAGGIVVSLAGAYYYYEAGNDETLKVAARDGRLLPGMTVDPRRVESADVDWPAAAKKFRALVLFPAMQSWHLSHPAVAAIAAGAGAAGLPIVVHVARSGDVGGLSGLARQVKVPVVAVGIAYGALSEVIAGAKAAGNLLIGMSLFGGLDNLETLVARLGADRIVYDSGEARFTHGPALKMLEAAEIDGPAREAIAIGNARRIFGGAL